VGVQLFKLVLFAQPKRSLASGRTSPRSHHNRAVRGLQLALATTGPFLERGGWHLAVPSACGLCHVAPLVSVLCTKFSV
jgi:hypothetical protein